MNDTDLEELEMPQFNGVYLHSYYGLLEIRSDMKKNILIHEGQNFRLKPITSDTFVAVDDKGHTAFTVGFPANKDGQTTKCIVVNSKACPEFKQVYDLNPHDWNNWEGKYSDGRESYEVWIQGESLMIKDLQNNMELTGRAINYNQFLTKEYGLLSFINIDDKINLEFDFAWRYPKLSIPALSLR